MATHYGLLALALYKKNSWKVHCVALAGLFAVTVLAMTARAVMNYNSDDNHFAMGAQLVADGYTPYVDFPYFQMPYASYIFGAILKYQLSAYKYLTLRLVNLAFCLGSIALVYTICSKVARSRRVALAGALLFSSSEFLNLAAEQLNSYAIANFFAILAFAALTVLDQLPTRRAFLSGVCLGIAIASKLYYALLAPPMLAFVLALIQPVTRQRAQRTGIFWLGGITLALIPVGMIAAIEPVAFLFDNYGYHILNSKYRDLSKSGDGMTISAKLKFFTQMLGKPTYLATCILCFILFSYAYRRPSPLQINRIQIEDRILLLATGSFAFMLAAAMTPRPLWPSYFLSPLPFAIIAIACLYGIGNRAKELGEKNWDLRLIYIAAFVSILSGPSNLHLLKKAMNVDAWSTLAIHKQGRRIQDLAVDYGQTGKLLAFEGLYAMEGELPFYRQMTGSTFAYRVGDMMDDDLRVRSNIISSSNIGPMLDVTPPMGILVSSRFDKFNSAMLKYATTNDYTEIDIKMPDHRFFISSAKKYQIE